MLMMLTNNLLRLLLMLLMMRIVLALVCCRFGSWGLVKKLKFCSDLLYRESEIKIWSRFNFVTSTKHQQQNTDQTSASKSRLHFNIKILTKPCAKSRNKRLAFWPNLSFQICNTLLPPRSLSSTSTTVTTSTSFELPSSHARVTSIKFTKRQLVSQLLTSIANDRTRVW